MLFTHEILNSFTSSFTASETPFSAFCLTTRRSYIESGSNNTFCSDETFVRVWFAFTRLQMLESGMKCPTCGPSPRIIIADGISLATHSSKLTSLVRPPTKTDDSSPRIESISSHKARQLPAIPQPDVRTAVLRLLEVTTSYMPEWNDLPASEATKLATLYPALFQLYALYWRSGIHSPQYRIYRTLFQQIAAPDIILQLIPFDAIQSLKDIGSGGLIPS